MCQEFDLTPSAVLAEEARLPVGLLERIVEARGYAATKAAYDADPKVAERDRSPLMAHVVEITFGLVQDEIDRKKSGA